MWLYFLIFFFILFLYSQARTHNEELKVALYVMSGLGLFVGLGDMLGGYDRYIYGEIFDDSADIRITGGSMDDVLYMAGAFEEKGYMLFNYLMSYLTANRYIFIFIASVFIYLSFYFAFRVFVKQNLLYAVILFMGMFFFITFTYLREVLAMCISFWALKAVIERRFVLFLLIVALAYTFHHSAILLFPIYFIPLKKWNPNIVVAIAIVCFFLGILGVSRIGFTAFSALTGGNRRADTYTNEFDVEGYFRIDYVMEAVFFLMCILTLYQRVEKDKRTLVLLNYSLMFCFILLLFTRSAQGGRLAWYFLIGVICLITELINKGPTRWREILIVVSFLLFYRIVTGWGFMISPYKSFLTSGVREGDLVHELYEYDSKYDNDKFYRPAFLLFGYDENYDKRRR